MNRTGLPRPFVALCVLIGALVGAYAVLMLISLATASTEHRTRTFAAAKTLHVEAGSGDVTVVGERRDDVRVEMAIQRGMWRGAWQPEIRTRAGGRDLRLTSECSLWAHVGVSDCGASFTIRVPRGTRVAIDAPSGDATVRNLAGSVTIDASSGDVSAADVAGPLTLGASSGDVDVFSYRGRVLDAHASSGDVTVRTLVAPRRLRADASSGDVDVAVPDATYRVAAEADSGDRTVAVRQNPDAPRRIEAHASSGDVTVVRLGDAGG